jgi:U3 small nucleolar ribonucleoprotein protein IMP4
MSVARDLQHELELDDDKVGAHARALDDEYASATDEPKILITTSRRPSPRLTQMAKELKLVFPGSQRMNRGNHVLKELVEAAKRHGLSDLVLVHETRGQPDGLVLSHLPHGPTAYFNLSQVVLRHDIRDSVDAMTQQYPRLVFDGFQTNLGKRVTEILKHLFPPPKSDSKRVITFSNREDTVSFRHHTWVYEEGKPHAVSGIQLNEVGPRFEMQVYRVKLGTLDQTEADDEWQLRAFTNTARKRTLL